MTKRTNAYAYGEGKVRQVRAPFFPDPLVAEDQLARVEEYYLQTCFAPAPAEDQSVPRSTAVFQATSPIRRVRVA